jgi:DNA-binding NarL/FixJ family response regulator
MKILLVDDHALFRDGVALLLKELDPAVQVWHASNVAEALAAIDEGAEIDLILLDFILPGTHGLQALEMMRERHPGVPLVMLSSLEDQVTVLRSFQLGAMASSPNRPRRARCSTRCAPCWRTASTCRRSAWRASRCRCRRGRAPAPPSSGSPRARRRCCG